jgi:hypothetical protein
MENNFNTTITNCNIEDIKENAFLTNTLNGFMLGIALSVGLTVFTLFCGYMIESYRQKRHENNEAEAQAQANAQAQAHALALPQARDRIINLGRAQGLQAIIINMEQDQGVQVQWRFMGSYIPYQNNRMDNSDEENSEDIEESEF